MSIQPPSDIVLDVANAADPTKALAATERLTRLGSGGPAVAAGGFQRALGAMSLPSNETTLRTRLAETGGTATPAVPKPMDARTKAFKGLETLVLQNLVETMLPKEGNAYFGDGAGGGMWRSMLAEKIGAQLSERLDLGIASKAAAVHTADDTVDASGVADARAKSLKLAAALGTHG